jgi:hypothetical protein
LNINNGPVLSEDPVVLFIKPWVVKGELRHRNKNTLRKRSCTRGDKQWIDENKRFREEDRRGNHPAISQSEEYYSFDN